MMSHLRIASLAGMLALLGAGCTGPLSVGTPRPTPPPATVASTEGFGKLPALSPLPATSSEALALSTGSAGRSQDAKALAPMVLSAPSAGGGSSGSGTAVASPGVTMPARPVPYPYPNPRPVTVEYVVEGQMPSWGASGDVLHEVPLTLDPSSVSTIGRMAGLPDQLMNGMAKVQSANFQWTDKNGYFWTSDIGSRTLSFSKEEKRSGDEIYGGSAAPTPSQEVEIIAAADAFLDAHGLSSVRQTGGKIQQTPWAVPMMGAVSAVGAKAMPCYIEAPVTSSIAPAPDGAASDYYPSPCQYYSPYVVVVYGTTREGHVVTDEYGNIQQPTSISVSLKTKDVVNGIIQMNGPVDRSAYPLIDLETASRRLMSGGRNPVGAWGSGSGNITVHLKTLEIVWMRVDSYKDNARDTYFLPALRASGTIDRGSKTAVPETYATIVPLLKDDVFETPLPEPYPVPLMRNGAEPVLLPDVVTPPGAPTIK